jgi:transposase-like protein
MAEPRYIPPVPAVAACEDCGAAITDKTAHTRFHSVLSAHAWTLAVLKTAHLAAHVHDRYEVVEKINSRRFDSWSNDALNEVAAEHGLLDP